MTMTLLFLVFLVAVLNGTTYQNNSIVTLEDIGEDGGALLCITNLTACCRASDTGVIVGRLGNWYLLNGSRVPSEKNQWAFYRARSKMVVRMNHRGGGKEGIYRCVIPYAMDVTKTIYIGVYSTKTGEWSIILCCVCCERGEIQLLYIFRQCIHSTVMRYANTYILTKML